MLVPKFKKYDFNGRLYNVSTEGEVYKFENSYNKINKSRKLIKQLSKDGYYRVSLNSKGIVKKVSIHRLVLGTFKYNSKLTVNHKNKIKTDNKLSNLEYMTISANNRHSKEKVILLINKNNGTILKFSHYIDITRKLKCTRNMINNVISGKKNNRLLLDLYYVELLKGGD